MQLKFLTDGHQPIVKNPRSQTDFPPFEPHYKSVGIDLLPFCVTYVLVGP